MENNYITGTGLSSYIDNPNSNITKLYRGEGAYDFRVPNYGLGSANSLDPYRGTWYTNNLPYAKTFSNLQGLSGIEIALGKTTSNPGIIRQLDVELPFSSYETSPNPTINKLLEDKKFLNSVSADSGTSLDNSKIVEVVDSDGKIKYVTEAQRKLTDARPPNVFSLNYPQEFVDANAKVNVSESFKNLFKNSYKTWSPDGGNYFTATYDSPYSSKFKIPSLKMAKNMMQDIYTGGKGIMSAYFNDVKKKYTPNFSNSSFFNNPITRGGLSTLRNVGFAGDFLLQAAAVKDVLTGSNHVSDGVQNINRMLGVPMDRQGNVIHNNRVYRNLKKAAQRDVQNPNEMKGVTSFDTTRYNPHTMNAGGIASLML